MTIFSLHGCSDYSVAEIIEYAPEIVVEPSSYSFGNIDAQGGTATGAFTITNVGNATLHLGDLELSNEETFSLSELATEELEPAESTSFEVIFDPHTYEFYIANVKVHSNDEEDPTITLPIFGSGDAPVINVTPDAYEFGDVVIGCDDELEVHIENVGNVDLQVSNIDFFASLPVDFAIGDYEYEFGALPWYIAPGLQHTIRIFYEPLDLVNDGSWLEITSNDPINPVVNANQDALNGAYAGYVTENFEQLGTVKTDILFVIDNSGSMSRNQTNLKNNFDFFINVFTAAAADFQIAFITTDSEEFVMGAIVTNVSTDPIGEVEDIIDEIGTSGSPLEAGLYYAYRAMQAGAEAEAGGTFSRLDSKLVVIYVSDEEDFSPNFSSMSPVDYANELRSQRSSNALVGAHAVAGDHPSGCSSTNGYAQYGEGYYDIVTELAGTFMSICTTDWGEQLDAIARETIASQIYYLSNDPIKETIEVVTDGTTSIDWEYDEVLNAIVFTIPPDEGSSTDVTYAIWGDCDEEIGDTADTGDTGQ